MSANLYTISAGTLRAVARARREQVAQAKDEAAREGLKWESGAAETNSEFAHVCFVNGTRQACALPVKMLAAWTKAMPDNEALAVQCGGALLGLQRGGSRISVRKADTIPQGKRLRARPFAELPVIEVVAPESGGEFVLCGRADADKAEKQRRTRIKRHADLFERKARLWEQARKAVHQLNQARQTLAGMTHAQAVERAKACRDLARWARADEQASLDRWAWNKAVWAEADLRGFPAVGSWLCSMHGETYFAEVRKYTRARIVLRGEPALREKFCRLRAEARADCQAVIDGNYVAPTQAEVTDFDETGQPINSAKNY